jgi:uncharacterized protein YeaO (DUF488 family)
LIVGGMEHETTASEDQMVVTKRAYESATRSDGTRILVDRLWPRGVKKEEAHVKQWMRELGPSNELRRFFGHDPKRWNEFRKRYLVELKRPEARALLDQLLHMARAGKLTLVYGAKDEEHNQAVVIKSVLESRLNMS